MASADGDEVVDAASHAGRKIKATWQVGRERKVSTGPERQQESRESQQRCSVNLPEQGRDSDEHCGGE